MHSILTTIIGAGSVPVGRSGLLLAIGASLLGGGAGMAVLGRRMLDDVMTNSFQAVPVN